MALLRHTVVVAASINLAAMWPGLLRGPEYQDDGQKVASTHFLGADRDNGAARIPNHLSVQSFLTTPLPFDCGPDSCLFQPPGLL